MAGLSGLWTEYDLCLMCDDSDFAVVPGIASLAHL